MRRTSDRISVATTVVKRAVVVVVVFLTLLPLLENQASPMRTLVLREHLEGGIRALVRRGHAQVTGQPEVGASLAYLLSGRLVGEGTHEHGDSASRLDVEQLRTGESQPYRRCDINCYRHCDFHSLSPSFYFCFRI